MITDPTIDRSDARRWAVNVLGLEDDSENIDLGRLLRIVTKSEYVVPAEQVYAIEILNNPATSYDIAVKGGRAQRLSASVTEFANNFFDLTPDQRSEQWQKLHQECHEIPSLLQWLDRLSKGLAVEVLSPSTDEQFNQLVSVCCEVFVAKFPVSIRRRQEFMASCREQPDIWPSIARRLQSKHQSFFDGIAPWTDQIIAIKADNANQDAMSRLRARETKKSNASTFSMGSIPWWVLIIWAVGFIGNLANGLKSKPDPSAGSMNSRSSSRPIVAPGPQGALQAAIAPSFLLKLRPDVVERMCRVIPGLEQSLADPNKRLTIDRNMTALREILPTLDDEVSLFFGSDAILNESSPLRKSLNSYIWYGKLLKMSSKD